MEDGSPSETLAIMSTVITIGLVVIIMATLSLTRYARIFSALMAFWAWGLIRVKRLNFWLQRTGRLDQMFSLMQIQLNEIAQSVMVLLILLFYMRPDRANLQDVRSVPFFLVGVVMAGYGMGVFFAADTPATLFFHGDLGVYFIAIGLAVVIAGGAYAQTAGASLLVYISALVVGTCISGDWEE
uniref:Uncharacterized protein n=1 Tax=Oryza brachyantha TaxID=4533 RepID=J3MP33_ORYBR